MSSSVYVALVTLALPLSAWALADDKPDPAKPVPSSTKPQTAPAQPAPKEPVAKPTPQGDPLAERRERMRQRDEEVDRILRQRAAEREKSRK